MNYYMRALNHRLEWILNELFDSAISARSAVNSELGDLD
jgi:hypothetical protein